MNFFSKDKKSAFEAKEAAQWIAFGPVIFQAARVLRNSGILKVIEESGSSGLTIEEIAEKVKLPLYGVRVLLESGLGLGLVLVNDKKYTLGKTGYFILNDPLTKTNMDFVHDVNYKGLFYLDESIRLANLKDLKNLVNGKPYMKGYRNCRNMCKKAGLVLIIFFLTMLFRLYYHRYITMV